jgi:glycosidase
MAQVGYCKSDKKIPNMAGVKIDAGTLWLTNDSIRLSFDLTTGCWSGLYAYGLTGNLIHPGPEDPGFDIALEGKFAVKNNAGFQFSSYTWRYLPDAAGITLTLEYRFTLDGKGQNIFKAKQEFTVRNGKSYVTRQVFLTGEKVQSDEGIRMEHVQMDLPGLVIGEPKNCIVDFPGPWFPASFIKPGSPYNSFQNRTIPFMHGAPDAGFGLISLSDIVSSKRITTWMTTGGEVSYEPAIIPGNPYHTWRFIDKRSYRIKSNMETASDMQQIWFSCGGINEALERYRESNGFNVDPVMPDWVDEMVLLEIHPVYFKGGFSDIRNRLPEYKKIGINAIYLMPHWVGGYMPLDLFEVKPEYGTKEELKQLVGRAHELGMKVFFDMVIHGFSAKSSTLQDEPEMFVRTESGSFEKHRVWKSISTDWASEEYSNYMKRLVRHDILTYNIDGYRVDAASFKNPGWNPDLPYPAYKCGSDAAALLTGMIGAMREIKPEAMMLSEVFGPLFYTVSNLGHDNNTEAPGLFLELLEKKEVTITDYKLHLERTRLMLPKDARRVYFARNHDTSWFYHFNGYTRPFMNLEAIHALCGIPEIFAGDTCTINPDEAVFNQYKQLFRIKGKHKAFSKGSLFLSEIASDQPNVFAAVREYKGEAFLVLVSVDANPVVVNLRTTGKLSGILKQKGSSEMERIFSDQPAKTIANPDRISLEHYDAMVIKIACPEDSPDKTGTNLPKQ